MADNLYVVVVAPDHQVFAGEAQSVKAPGLEGSFQVLPRHAPMIAAIGVGPMTVTTASGEDVTFATSGGFLEVLNNTVTVLAETAEPASGIDVDRARAAEERARQRLQEAGSEERAMAEASLERARNRLRIAMGQIGG